MEAGQNELNQTIKFYYVDPSHIISRMLLMPEVVSKMTFVPVLSEGHGEVYHSRLFRESPLFGFQQLSVNGHVYNCGSLAIWEAYMYMHALTCAYSVSPGFR